MNSKHYWSIQYRMYVWTLLHIFTQSRNLIARPTCFLWVINPFLVLNKVSANAMLSAQPRQERTQTFLVPGWNSRNLVQTGHIWSLCIHFRVTMPAIVNRSTCDGMTEIYRNIPKWSAGCQLHLQNWDVRSLLCINSLSLTDTCNFWALLPAFLAGAPHWSTATLPLKPQTLPKRRPKRLRQPVS